MGALALAMGAMLILSLNLNSHDPARTGPITAEPSKAVGQPGRSAKPMVTASPSRQPHPSGSLPSRRPPVIKPSPTTSRTAELTPSLVGAWSFDEGEGGKASDSSGYGRSVTLANGATWGAGSTGRGLELDGQDDFGEASTILRTDAGFTVSAWVRLDSDARRAVAVAQEGEIASGFYLMYHTSGQWLMEMKTADDSEPNYTSAAASVAPKLGEWTHLTGVYDPLEKQLRIYVNGVRAGVASHESAWQAGGQFLIGRCRSYGTAHYFWTGALDEVRVYRRALTDQEILANVYHGSPAGNMGV